MIAAGGTGGHVYPALAVAEAMLARRSRGDRLPGSRSSPPPSRGVGGQSAETRRSRLPRFITRRSFSRTALVDGLQKFIPALKAVEKVARPRLLFMTGGPGTLFVGALILFYYLGIIREDMAGIRLEYIYPVRIALLLIPTMLAVAWVSALAIIRDCAFRTLMKTPSTPSQ